jgi:hypothetical protein
MSFHSGLAHLSIDKERRKAWIYEVGLPTFKWMPKLLTLCLLGSFARRSPSP